MRKSRTSRADRKQEARTRILDAAARRICAEGFDGAAIAPVMNDAGLTHGTFYTHFANKADLAAEAFRHAIRSRRGGWIGGGTDRSWSERLRRLAATYLSRQHRDDRSGGCPFAGLASEMGRGDIELRPVHEEQLRETLDEICAPVAAGDEPGDHRLDEAIALLAICVGGVALARAVEDEDLSDRILRACRMSVNAGSQAA